MLNPEQPPELITQRWFNTDAPLTLASLKGKVIVLTAFQTHCPGSLKHGLPQAARLAAAFNTDEVTVIGLNTAFEEHDKQAAGALEAFIRDNDFTFAIAKDKPNGAELPKTMTAYEIQGTPTMLVFDRQGRLRRHYLGQVDDIRLAAEVMTLVIESRDAPREQSAALERRLAAALVDPDAHSHDHGGGCCGGNHDHGHDHGHDHHAHSHDDGCCGGAHTQGDHDHGDDAHAHQPAAAPVQKATAAQPATAAQSAKSTKSAKMQL